MWYKQTLGLLHATEWNDTYLINMHILIIDKYRSSWKLTVKLQKRPMFFNRSDTVPNLRLAFSSYIKKDSKK